jgi:hypothetical protein
MATLRWSTRTRAAFNTTSVGKTCQVLAEPLAAHDPLAVDQEEVVALRDLVLDRMVRRVEVTVAPVESQGKDQRRWRSRYRASRLACRRCPLDRMWPWIAVA